MLPAARPSSSRAAGAARRPNTHMLTYNQSRSQRNHHHAHQLHTKLHKTDPDDPELMSEEVRNRIKAGESVSGQWSGRRRRGRSRGRRAAGEEGGREGKGALVNHTTSTKYNHN